jgi:hypothetical protein
MLDSVIAVAGTLLGCLLTALTQQRSERAARAHARSAQRQDAQIQAIAALSCALADHRRTMWAREHARLGDASAKAYAAARAESHTTRAAITAPLTTVCILAPHLAHTARAAAQAVYALRQATDVDALTALRHQALAVADRLIDDAAHLG